MAWRDRLELAGLSALILFLELACIRWFPAHVLYLTFFTNVVLLAAFLGISVGCLAARRGRDWLPWTAALLALALAAGHLVEYQHQRLRHRLDVGGQQAPELIFFGTEGVSPGAAFAIPMEALAGFFFLLLALVFVGPGQALGRLLARFENRVLGYTLNIAGSLAGIALFALVSWLETPPSIWFLGVAGGLGYFLWDGRARVGGLLRQGPALAAVLALAALPSAPGRFHPQERLVVREQHWSPYYRVDYEPGPARRNIWANLIGHQSMVAREGRPAPAYAIPYALRQELAGAPFEDVLIIGAGSGNDVSRALASGARRVDAVEIDPVIQRLGVEHHPDRPYQDPRVRRVLDDGRNFLRRGEERYDLIVYALVDSLVLHSGHSNIRLESYLFTKDAFDDVARRLKPGGWFVAYNYFRQGWLVGRLKRTLEASFATAPVLFGLPHEGLVEPDSRTGFTLAIASKDPGLGAELGRRFAEEGSFWIAREWPGDGLPAARFADEPPGSGYERVSPAEVVVPADLEPASDDWPFFYLRRPMLPALSLRGALVMAAIALLLLWRWSGARGRQGGGAFPWRMFFLGAGFMLVETRAVVHMALLFGSTWTVNSVVFAAILLAILAANGYVLLLRPRRVGLAYALLFTALAANILWPLDAFLGVSRGLQIALSSTLVFSPILFAGVVFSMAFARAVEPDRSLGANVAGAMLGGLAETSSMLLGFRHLLIVAAAFYMASWLLGSRAGTRPALP